MSLSSLSESMGICAKCKHEKLDHDWIDDHDTFLCHECDCEGYEDDI